MLVIPESLKELQLRFTCPELSSSWIEYIFYYLGEDPFETQAWLQKHILIQSVVTQLYVYQDVAKIEGDFDEQQKYENSINRLVRFRNITLNNLEKLHQSQLIFDLNHFTVSGAVEFVRDISRAMEKRLMDSDEGTTSCDMTLITFIEQEKPPEKKIQKKIETPEWFTILTWTLIPNVGLPEISEMEMLAINELFRKEEDSQKWIEDFNEITPLLPVEAIRATFYNRSSQYGVGYHWVRHLYYVFERDMKTTVARLRWDIVHRLLIQHHYEFQTNLRGHDFQERQEKINDLARRRNFSLDQLEKVPKTQLKFDLHFFRVDGALEYVDDVIESIESSKTILANASLDITLFTGHGDHSPNNDPAIRRKLLEEYHGRIREDPKIRGALILHFDKKTENSISCSQ
ncbi:Protein CBG27264 [Caenorhabditis briggsae]|uniref:Protein CBG27264 n=1 Tax=Caenorhabditis briggsae TaxID=6238 RepID=B6IFT3_CAEBR|nr:Protein CBG27264 [Caenorhabditis briggsae]CAR98801.1 Protein CBG27264 [Caenorhabditis briggsae]